MHVDHDAAASAFREQLATLLRVGTNLDDRALLAASRCHGWAVADVLVHLHFGLQEMLLGTLSTTDARPTPTPRPIGARHRPTAPTRWTRCSSPGPSPPPTGLPPA